MPFTVHIAGLLLMSGLFFLNTPKPTMPPPPPPPPTLISPVDGALMDNGCADKSNGVTWDFDWSDVPGATRYHIRVFRNPAIPAINDASVAVSSYNYDSPQTYIINANRTGWRWMVRARTPTGGWGPWSKVRFFRVEKLNADCP